MPFNGQSKFMIALLDSLPNWKLLVPRVRMQNNDHIMQKKKEIIVSGEKAEMEEAKKNPSQAMAGCTVYFWASSIQLCLSSSQ